VAPDGLAFRHVPAGLPVCRQAGDERFQAKYGYWRPIVERSVTAFLRCGDLDEGFARVRCGDCGHEMFACLPVGRWPSPVSSVALAPPATRSGRS